MIYSSEAYSVILALTAAAAAGLVGSFALMKRMSLAGDVISHIALPGLGLALLFKINPLTGGAATLLIGTLIIWHLQKSTTLTTETAIGVIFIAALAIGTLVTPSEDLIEALFGGFGVLHLPGFLLGLLGALVVIVFIFKFKDQLVLSVFSPELAAANGLNVHRLNLYYLLVFSLTILLGLQFLGAILVGALIIVPAAIGRQLTDTLAMFLFASATASVLAVLSGFYLATVYALPLGPTIVSSAAGLFLLSLLKPKR